MNDPDPDNFSSCSFVKAARRSDSEIVMLDVSLVSVVVLNDCFGRLLLVGRPDPREREVDLGVGAKLIISLSTHIFHIFQCIYSKGKIIIISRTTF